MLTNGGTRTHLYGEECVLVMKKQRQDRADAEAEVKVALRGRGGRCVSAKCGQLRTDAELTRRWKEALVVGKLCVLVSGVKRSESWRAVNVIRPGSCWPGTSGCPRTCVHYSPHGGRFVPRMGTSCVVTPLEM